MDPTRRLDAPGLACIDVTPLIASTMREMQPDDILEVHTDDPAARVGVPAWCRLTRNPLVHSRAHRHLHQPHHLPHREEEPQQEREPALTNPTATRALLIQGTHGADDPEKATLPFIVGNVAATADQDTVVFLTSEAVRLATRGYADDISFATHPPTGKILADFIANGGRVWACGACTGPRGITADDLVDGATIVTAANLVEVVTDGAKTVGF